MNATRRALYGITDQDWKDARARVRESMIGGRVQYRSRKDWQKRNGQFAKIVRRVLTSRELVIQWENDGQQFRDFAHNFTPC